MLSDVQDPLSQRVHRVAEDFAETVRKYISIAHPCIPATNSKLSIKLLCPALLFITIAGFLIRALLNYKSPRYSQVSREYPEKPGTSTLRTFKSPDRPPGVWIPVDFKRPAVTPYPSWDIHKTEPLPYRPFKYGPGYITMGLRAMKWDEWIELDNRYFEWQSLKSNRIAERGEKCCRTAPEAYDGAIELLEELFSYLPQRYPTLFSSPSPTTLTNLITRETYNLSLPLQEDPMATAGRLIQDDLALMIERSDGQYYLLAGSILLAGFWRLSDKFGMPLSEIHTSASVPEFKPKLEHGMMKFFRRLQPPNPVVRNNYFIQVDPDLAWSRSLGPEDGTIGWTNSSPAVDVTTHYFRSERQTLRRLPRSGAIAFTIRTYFEPVVKIAQEKGVPGRLASAIRGWGEETVQYKGREKYGEALLAYLDRRHREQVESGEVAEGDEGEEDGNVYPF